MSSIENPSAPRTPSPVAEASEVHDDNRGLSSDDESFQAHEFVQDDSIDEDFLRQHLRAAPDSFSVTNEMKAYVDEVCAAGTSEPKMYKPAASLLTAISKEVFKSLDEGQRESHKKRQHIRSGQPGHLTFIDHHSKAPTHFPQDGVLSNVLDAPDLLGVYDVDLFEDNKDDDGVYKGVPHHRVEAIVKAKSEDRGGGRRQATTYAYRHHQARPDRPGFYFLVIKPKWYQVLYSDPTGVFASPQTPWTNTQLLAAYIYSHYDPPANHFLWDETIKWSEHNGFCTFPSWKIELNGQWYKHGQFIFVGDPWSRLTSTFDVVDGNGEHIIIKDCYRRDGRRFTEEAILEHIHAEGDLLGVVRLMGYVSGLRFILKGQVAQRTRVRFAFFDTGSRLLKAKTVNDLLKATYDALEVHRTKLVQRKVLHRDMSLYNMLMYPVWRSMEGRQAHKDSPPMIQDVLSGQTRPLEERVPACLAIDYDNAARLDHYVTKPQELMQRTGTPMYIARSVCRGEVLTDFENRIFPPMPELSEEARALYVDAHGPARYDRYNDDDTKLTRHGACPPHFDDFEKPRQFCHRPEHDVESVYWSMVSALLNVRPKRAKEEENAALQDNWHRLLANVIPDKPYSYTDPRDLTLKQNEAAWRDVFLGGMKDLAALLFNISRQIRPEYAFFADDLQQDHLHEAVQRLILQYLTDHDDIPLDPDHLRPIPKGAQPTVTVTRASKRTTTKGSDGGSGVKKTTRGSTGQGAENASTDSGTKRKSAAQDAGQSDGSAGSSSRTRNAIVVHPKRKSSSQTGQSSKRLRNNSGLPQSIEEGAEEGA